MKLEEVLGELESRADTYLARRGVFSMDIAHSNALERGALELRRAVAEIRAAEDFPVASPGDRPPEVKTRRVRIAVSIDSTGERWSAVGYEFPGLKERQGSPEYDDLMADGSEDGLDAKGPTRTVFVEVDVPLAQRETIQAKLPE